MSLHVLPTPAQRPMWQAGQSELSKIGIRRSLAPESEMPRFPVVEASARGRLAESKPLSGRVLFLVGVHVRFSMIALVKAAIAAGAAAANIVIAIKAYEYPERAAVVRRLKRRGVTEIFAMDAFESALASVERRMNSIQGELVVIDDGGYGACALSARPDLLARTTGFVEQTTRGKWKVAEQCERLGTTFPRPIICLPDSEVKQTFECLPVGQIVVEALERHLSAPVAGRRVAVIGASGTIGGAAANALVDKGALVQAYDRAPKSAYWELIKLGRLNVCPTKRDALTGVEIVIGATGESWLSPRDLRSLHDGVLLASASSGQYEFPLDLLRQLASKVKPHRAAAGMPIHGDAYHMPWGKKVVVLDGGRPLNLGIAASPEHPCFDLITALLFLGALEIASGRYRDNVGFVNDFDKVCARHRVAELYLLLHGGDA